MRLSFATEHEGFRKEISAWLHEQMSGPFRHLRGIVSMAADVEGRREWDFALAKAGLSCIGWPNEFGGREASIAMQVIFAEEYARAQAPVRLGHIGVELLGPTLLAFGTEAQKQRFLAPIAAGNELWCQGYSEPNAGSDLANVRTKARLISTPQGEVWQISGQKVWTSLAHFSDWIFTICRTEEGSRGSKGLSFLLVPMRQPGITVRPIRQMTGDAEFNEVFFDEAVTQADNIVGKPGDGWSVAMGLLNFERGVSTLGQQMGFRNELDAIIAIAKKNGKAQDPIIRQRIAESHIGLKIMRYSALRMLSAAEGASLPREAYTYKIYWANWHQKLGELAMDIIGPEAELGEAPYQFPLLTNMYLMSRSETIYAGTNQIQRNIIAERALGLPREPRG